MSKKNLYAGIMTGNSLDAVDIVLTDFADGHMKDICFHSKSIPLDIAQDFRKLKQLLTLNHGDINETYQQQTGFFISLHNRYINLVAQTFNELIHQNSVSKTDICAIGFHGQTCYHFPPSIAGKNNEPNTLQIGSGQMLSNLTGLPVVFDFRSDDIINGGEGAPLAPIHNLHIAQATKLKSAVFCNGGNTGNIAAINNNQVIGWDCGPFNHFVDYLTREEKNEACDFDGKYGRKGKVNTNLLKSLFNNSVITSKKQNFLLQNPPKSADPAWYDISSLKDISIPFNDRIRTAEFFSAYIMAFSLKFLPCKTPDNFLVFGGGWNNPIIFEDFKNILHQKTIVLPQHQEIFSKIANPKAQISWSDNFGFSSKYMEARIFADMANCKINNIPYSTPQTTGCKTPTICGIVAYPNQNNSLLWSRAAKGWSKK
ncbi:MAG: anhydro-N-acetylmuramic acid kinase [Alphaproteobacteria bacterium]|nr:anhydro-N-acetylmuramic acid kinase [Alphaproteobacteria bacterium]